jgi:hypothetical protein
VHSPPAAIASYTANFPFNGTGGNQKITMDMNGISKVNFSYNSGNLYYFFFELDREITGSILQNHKWSLKTRHRAVNSQRQKTVFFLQYQNMGLVRVK